MYCMGVTRKFCQMGSNFDVVFFGFILVYKGREYLNTTISRPSSAHQGNTIFMACLWWPNNECWLGSFVIFQGIPTSSAKKPYIFVIFQRSRPPVPLPLDTPMYYSMLGISEYYTPLQFLHVFYKQHFQHGKGQRSMLTMWG